MGTDRYARGSNGSVCEGCGCFLHVQQSIKYTYIHTSILRLCLIFFDWCSSRFFLYDSSCCDDVCSCVLGAAISKLSLCLLLLLGVVYQRFHFTPWPFHSRFSYLAEREGRREKGVFAEISIPPGLLSRVVCTSCFVS